MVSAGCAVAPPAPAEAGLAPVHAFVREAVESGHYLGAVTLVARHGRIVDWRAWGYRDLARTAPLRRDDIFAIYSMTKPVATVAMLQLAEEGRLALDDRLGRHLPGFAARAVTLRHLLTHTSGLAQASERMEEAPDLATFAAMAAEMPQKRAPGTQFEYASVNSELVARVVEVASGLPFEEFLQRRLFGPLGMRDTGFTVPPGKRARLAAMTATDDGGKLVEWPTMDAPQPGARVRRYTSAAGGLYSTAADYVRFCHMLAAGGALEGVRILSSASVEAMFSNQLTMLSPPVSQYGEGFGLGGFVNLDDPKRTRPGSVGAYGWSGAGGTYFMIDRTAGLVALLLTQHSPRDKPTDPPKLSMRFYNLLYQWLDQRQPAT